MRKDEIENVFDGETLPPSPVVSAGIPPGSVVPPPPARGPNQLSAISGQQSAITYGVGVAVGDGGAPPVPTLKMACHGW